MSTRIIVETTDSSFYEQLMGPWAPETIDRSILVLFGRDWKIVELHRISSNDGTQMDSTEFKIELRRLDSIKSVES